MHIRTRNELIKFIEDNAPSRAILRAVLNHNENLGGFRKLPGSNRGGWIVKAMTSFGLTVLIVVQPNTTSGYKIWLMSSVSWRYYEGHTSDNPLYQGDNPEKYKELMRKEIEENGNE